jgi:hypothetical protein
MRLVQGHARLVAITGGYAIEAKGLQYPARLSGLASGAPLPDLSASAGVICDFSGILTTPVGNINELSLLVTDLSVPQQTLSDTGHLLAVVSGRIGKPAEPNREANPDWYTAHLCYANGPDRDTNGSWLRITSRTYASVTDPFTTLETGAKITAAGFLETWLTSDASKPRCALSLRGLERTADRSFAAATAPSQSLVTSAAPIEAEPDDAFVAA